jgi:hypothetical protein
MLAIGQILAMAPFKGNQLVAQNANDQAGHCRTNQKQGPNRSMAHYHATSLQP